MEASERSRRAALQVLNNLKGRCGIGDELESVSQSIYEEIEDTVARIILRNFEDYTGDE